MKQLLIRKINWNLPAAEKLSLQFDKEAVPSQRIDTVNWKAYPYCPKVTFRIAHNGEAIFLNYHVNESDIKAVCNRDNGKVWEDSCVEFFVSFDSSLYYNIECNCIGKILIGKGYARNGRVLLSGDMLKSVDRWSSLGDAPVENRSGDWEISLIIPKTIFYPDTAKTLDNIEAKGNFYKCGDCLQTPHFISWNPIQSETPDFHRPEYFGQLHFD